MRKTIFISSLFLLGYKLALGQRSLEVNISEVERKDLSGLVEYPDILKSNQPIEKYVTNAKYLFDFNKKQLLFYFNDKLVERIKIIDTYRMDDFFVIRIVSKDNRNPKEKLSSTYMVNLVEGSNSPKFMYYWYYDNTQTSTIEISTKLDVKWGK
jgi:hypothetical protein